MKAVIFGLEGPRLGAEERALFRACEPAGYILFGRNIVDRAQLRALTDDLRALHGRDDLFVMIDQEGGRVARLRPPEWPDFPAAGRFDALYSQAPSAALAACRLNARAMAECLRAAGIRVNAMPMLDVRQADADAVLGDRCFGSEPLRVAALGRAALDGLRAGGVAGILKHMPGHGRARADSHTQLPVVSADAPAMESDLAPFRSLHTAPIGMTAHILYSAWDARNPASLSSTVIGGIIRDGLGFDGLLLSDDIGMDALAGTMAERARGVVSAGCDLALQCHGTVADRAAVAAAVPDVGPLAQTRLERALAWAQEGEGRLGVMEAEGLLAQRDALLGSLAG